MLWFVPAGLALLAVIPIVIAVRRVTREATLLRRELAGFSELRPALLELRSDVTVVRNAAVATSRRLPRR